MAYSKLDAVNSMLASVGSQAVASLSGDLDPEALNAVTVLDRQRMQALMEGWHFNTDTEVQWTPDGLTSQITPPADVLWFHENAQRRRGRQDLTLRNGVVYDRNGKTDLFTSPVYVDVVLDIEFDDLPTPFQHYVAARGTHAFQAGIQGDRVVLSITDDEVTKTRAAVQAYENASGQANMIHSNWTGYSIAGRPSPGERIPR